MHVRLFDFAIYNQTPEDSDNERKFKQDETQFLIQMFGITETGESCSIKIDNYQPFFYIKVCDKWKKNHLEKFKSFLLDEIPRRIL